MPSRPALATLAVAAAAIASTTALSLPAAAATGTASATATAATAAAPATGPVESVTLSLAPRDRASLTALATAHGLSQATRQARIDAAVPGTARAADVAQRVAALGLTVTGTSEFTVEAQAPASRVLALFGSARAHNPSLPTAQTLPQLPSTLAGLVDVAVGGDDTRPALESHTLRAQSQARSSASAPTDGSLSVTQARGISRIPTTTSTPAVPSGSDQTVGAPIVASLQFPSPNAQSASGFSATLRDLHTFATTNKIYGGSDFPSSMITSSSASGCQDTIDYSQGDQTPDEVALDQETLLVAAPQLRQRIYYAPNCGSGEDDAVQQVYTDVTTNKLPIVALTTSWGECEPEVTGYLASDQTVLAALVATGVQVFAAAGDTGSSDCVGDPTVGDAVDDPGSVPGVVSVGGTQGLRAATLATWNDGTNATGGGFSCVSGTNTKASGGQPSTINGFSRPSYQSSVARTPTYPHNGFRCTPSSSGARQVPDIATSSAEGLDVVVSEDPTCSSSCLIYGTSFSAPLAAGGYAQTLVQGGKNAAAVANAGGLSSLLYGSQPANAITDVVQGNNGDYAAGTGWDPNTGLGSPKWPYVLSSVLGTTVPSTGASTLPVFGKLTAGQVLTSPNGNTTLIMQTDGNLVLYDGYTGTPVPTWNSGTSGSGNYAVLQGDSNFVVYSSANKALRSLNTAGDGIDHMQIDDDGSFAGFTKGGLVAWTIAGGATGYAGGDRIPAGGLLYPTQSIWSPNGQWHTVLQSDGNLVTDNASNQATFATGSPMTAGDYATLDPLSGTLRLTQPGGTVDSTIGPAGNPYTTLSLNNSGVLALTASNGQVVWTGSTQGNRGAATGLTADSLTPGTLLTGGMALWSANAAYRATMQSDGNFVLYNTANQALWYTRTNVPGSYARFQADGNFVVYAPNGSALFNTGTQQGTQLILQSDGNLVMYNASHRALWSRTTGRLS